MTADRSGDGPPNDHGRQGAGRLIALVPVRSIEGAKSRLGDVLDAEERRDLVVRMLERTIRAATGSARIAATIVVSADPLAREIAEAAGARAIDDPGLGLVEALDEARRAALEAGATAVLVVPIDLAEVSSVALDAAIDTAFAGDSYGDPSAPLVALVPDRHHRGTNVLLLRPPDAIGFSFGGDSRAAHAGRAGDAGVRFVELGGPLVVDLDTPEDLLMATSAAGEGDRGR